MKVFMPKIYTREDMRSAYRCAMYTLDCAISNAYFVTKTSRSDVVRRLITALKIDLFGSDITQALFSATDDYRKWRNDFIPHFPMPKNCNIERRINMPVEDNIVVSVPWRKSRWGKTGGYFFPEIQLIRVVNDRHHLTLAKLKNQGTVNVDVYPLILCFPYFKTDGAYWIDKRSGKKESVREIRFAILYALARELWKEDNPA